MVGRVVSVKTDKTATVLVTGTVTHPLYKKSFTRSKKYLAEDTLGVSLGDIVEMTKIKPISKRKHWKILKVVGRSIEEMVGKKLQEKAAQAIGEVMPEPVVQQEEKTEVAETLKTDKPKKRRAVKKEAK